MGTQHQWTDEVFLKGTIFYKMVDGFINEFHLLPIQHQVRKKI